MEKENGKVINEFLEIMQEDLKERAELALCIALSDSNRGGQPGRIKGLLKQLSKAAAKRLDNKPKISKKLSELCYEKIVIFSKKLKWDSRERHILTYISSLAIITENRKYKEINEIFVEILDYYERVDLAKASCFWPGEIAKKTWDDVWTI